MKSSVFLNIHDISFIDSVTLTICNWLHCEDLLIESYDHCVSGSLNFICSPILIVTAATNASWSHGWAVKLNLIISNIFYLILIWFFYLSNHNNMHSKIYTLHWIKKYVEKADTVWCICFYKTYISKFKIQFYHDKCN